VAGTHVPSGTQIVWNWNPVSGANGYKWNTTNSYTTATDLGNVTTKTETGLTCNTSYTRFVWAYGDCGYSSATLITQSTLSCSWACGDNLTDTRDSKTYSTVLIGSQCWMKQNLNFGTRIAATTDQLDNSIFEKYCYSNTESNCDIYGGLYQWAEMVQYLNGATNTTSWNPVPTGNVQGMCPAGWHIPTDEEWTLLKTYVSGQAIYLCNSNANFIAKSLASTTLWNSSTVTCAIGNNPSLNNTTELTAYPGGRRISVGNNFYNLNADGNFWSSTQDITVPSSKAYSYKLSNGSEVLQRAANTKIDGYSVRCVKD
jgi:uncharacterized protein (TIGR02145 family)